MTPTEQTYGEFQLAYRHFNEALFGGALPNCLITMQRQAGSFGYFRCQPFVNKQGERTDEIALNPRYFASRTERGVLSTLVHEMAHLHQFRYGRRGRAGYHDRQWANEMIQLGLYPSSTGEAGGRETGYRMSHYIVEQGPFDLQCQRLLADGFQFSWLESAPRIDGIVPPTIDAVRGIQDRSNRCKYTCPQCRDNAWGKPSLSLICGRCMTGMARKDIAVGTSQNILQLGGGGFS